MQADNHVTLMTVEQMQVVIIRDDLNQPVMYIPVRHDFKETDDMALLRATRICTALNEQQDRRIAKLRKAKV